MGAWIIIKIRLLLNDGAFLRKKKCTHAIKLISITIQSNVVQIRSSNLFYYSYNNLPVFHVVLILQEVATVTTNNYKLASRLI